MTLGLGIMDPHSTIGPNYDLDVCPVYSQVVAHQIKATKPLEALSHVLEKTTSTEFHLGLRTSYLARNYGGYN